MKVATLALGLTLAVGIPSLYLLSPRPRRQAEASSAFGAAGASRVIEEFKPASAKERVAAALDELDRARGSGRYRPPCHGDILCRRRHDEALERGLRAPFSFNHPRLFCAASGFTADGWSDDRKAFRGIDGSVTCSGVLELWANMKRSPVENYAKCCCEDKGSCCKETLAGECAPRDATRDWEKKFVVEKKEVIKIECQGENGFGMYNANAEERPHDEKCPYKDSVGICYTSLDKCSARGKNIGENLDRLLKNHFKNLEDKTWDTPAKAVRKPAEKMCCFAERILEPTLDMCDPNNTHSVAWIDRPTSRARGKKNSTFFKNMGYRGQSCDDWHTLMRYSFD